ncbi:MAG TPA: hypothetical protein VND67_01345 [Acidimicrobiales bacterium]|nr:hypothetical protein [Acidimicrobiales bacterium]
MRRRWVARGVQPTGVRRDRGDAGGLWIGIGIAGGVALYAGMLIMLVAGFTAILPFVIIPPVLIGLIGANSLLGGPRRPRPPARPIRPTDRGMAPPASGGPVVNGRSGDSSEPDRQSHPNRGGSAGSG